MPLRFITCRIMSWVLLGFAGMPVLVHAAATAQGVALNINAGCSAANLDLTLTTVGASREFGLATDLTGATLNTFEQATPSLGTFSGTFEPVDGSGYHIQPLTPPALPSTLIGAYAYVGTTPPSAATTAEFFVYYNCSTRQVLLSCFGPYGSCPQTAQAAQAAIPIPALDTWRLALAMLLLLLSALVALRRRA
jgi:hypothetical protein